MAKSFNFNICSDIMYALGGYNKTLPDNKLQHIDGDILCLVKSFDKSNNKMYMSNAEIAKLLCVGEKTVQRAVNRLVDHKLVNKIIKHENGKRYRYLIYNKENMHEFLKYK